MYYPGQLIRIHPKLTTLEQRSYHNTTGLPIQDEDDPDYDEVTYFNNEMRYLAGTTQYVVDWNESNNTLQVTRKHDTTWCWTLIPDWVLPTQTFKEL